MVFEAAGNVTWCLRMLEILLVFEDAGKVGWCLKLLRKLGNVLRMLGVLSGV